MLNILVFLSDNKPYREIFSDIFRLDCIFYSEDEARYSKKLDNDARYFFDYSKSSLEYSVEELSQIPYKVSEICDISFYPPEILSSIVSALADCDKTIYIDDDHGTIANVTEYKKIINIP